MPASTGAVECEPHIDGGEQQRHDNVAGVHGSAGWASVMQNEPTGAQRSRYASFDEWSRRR